MLKELEENVMRRRTGGTECLRTKYGSVKNLSEHNLTVGSFTFFLFLDGEAEFSLKPGHEVFARSLIAVFLQALFGRSRSGPRILISLSKPQDGKRDHIRC